MSTSNNYISVVYDQTRTPKTNYPAQLANYLMKRFGISKGDKLLELGCGRGDFLNAFHEQGLECFGVDRDESSKSFQPHLKIETCDLSKNNLPFADESFDVIYHKSVLEHVYDPTHLMLESRRVLKKGGKLVFLTPDWVSQMAVFYEDFTHCRPYDVAATRDILRVFGFNNIQAERFYQLPQVWHNPLLKFLCLPLKCLPVRQARWLAEKTGIKFFRWYIELMVLGYGEK